MGAKHRRRKTLRQEKSELRRAGDAKGFEKTDPTKLDNSELPKITVTKEEVELANQVLIAMGLKEADKKDVPEEDSDPQEELTEAQKKFFTEENIGNYSLKTFEEQVDTLVDSLIKK